MILFWMKAILKKNQMEHVDNMFDSDWNWK